MSETENMDRTVTEDGGQPGQITEADIDGVEDNRDGQTEGVGEPGATPNPGKGRGRQRQQGDGRRCRATRQDPDPGKGGLHEGTTWTPRCNRQQLHPKRDRRVHRRAGRANGGGVGSDETS